MDQVTPIPGPRKAPRSRKGGFFHFCPLFAYLLIFFIIVEVAITYGAGSAYVKAIFGTNVRAPLFALGNYALSWVEIFYLAAAFLSLSEMLKVSEPMINNTYEALAILLVSVVYLLLFALGAADAKIWIIPLNIFSNTEFMMLTIIAAFQTGAAFIINSRTIQLQVV